MVEYSFGCNLRCTTHIITYLSHMRTCIILSHFKTIMKNMPWCILTDRYNYVIFKYQNLTILHLGTSLARFTSVEPTHLILKCQDLENYFKAPWPSSACPGVCAWRLRQTMRRGGSSALIGRYFRGRLAPPLHLTYFIPSARGFARQDYTSENVIILQLTPPSDGYS